MFKSIKKEFFTLTIIETQDEYLIMTRQKYCKQCATELKGFKYFCSKSCAKTYRNTNERVDPY